MQASRTGYVILIVSIYWMTAALPLAVTSLLPIALLPLLGVQGTNEVCSAYFKGPVVVCFCSVALALGTEQSQLHRRLAYKALLFVGVDPKVLKLFTINWWAQINLENVFQWLLMGLMTITALMSMWISNMAVTAVKN